MPGRSFVQIPGPTNIPERVLRAMDRPIIDHRGADFAVLVERLLPKVRRVFGTRTGTPVIYPASGTGGWEASLVNTLSPGDAVLAFVMGQFSGGYARAAERLGLAVERVELPWGSPVPPERVHEALAADRERRIRAVLVIHNETSTGVMCDLAGIREAMDRAGHPALLMVDTVSGLGSLDFRFDEWGVDVAVAGSQKGLLLPPGLAVLCVSDKARQAAETARLPRSYFDWEPIMEQNRSGRFPYTPATLMLFGLDAALDMLFEEGLEAVFARHARLAEGVRRAVAAWGLRLVAERPQAASHVLTAVRLDDGHDAGRLIRLADERWQLSLGAGLGELRGRAFRIGHLGWLGELEVLAALAGVEMGLHEIGVPVQPGSGVAAAQRWFLGAA